MKTNTFLDYVSENFGQNILESVKELIARNHGKDNKLNAEASIQILEKVISSTIRKPSQIDELFDKNKTTLPNDVNGKRTLNLELVGLNAEYFKRLNRYPEELFKVSPRRFEEIIAELLRDMGCEIHLTPQTRDGGRDVFAAFKTPIGEFLTIVECKRYQPSAPVGIAVVERFLWTITQTDRASCGLIATTSTFTLGAKDKAREYKYLLKLREFEGLKEWISNYGNWKSDDNSTLWLPTR